MPRKLRQAVSRTVVDVRPAVTVIAIKGSKILWIKKRRLVRRFSRVQSKTGFAVHTAYNGKN